MLKSGGGSGGGDGGEGIEVEGNKFAMTYFPENLKRFLTEI